MHWSDVTYTVLPPSMMRRGTRWSSCTPNLRSSHSFWIVVVNGTRVRLQLQGQNVLIGGHRETACTGWVYILSPQDVVCMRKCRLLVYCKHDFRDCRTRDFLFIYHVISFLLPPRENVAAQKRWGRQTTRLCISKPRDPDNSPACMAVLSFLSFFFFLNAWGFFFNAWDFKTEGSW